MYRIPGFFERTFESGFGEMAQQRVTALIEDQGLGISRVQSLSL